MDIFDFFGPNKLSEFAFSIWNLIMSVVCGIAVETPESFSNEAWHYVSHTITPFTMAVGATGLNIFFIVSLIRQANNLKENYTMETLVESCIKLVLANMLIVNGKNIMSLMFKMASTGTGLLLNAEDLNFVQKDADAGSVLFYFFFNGIFLIVSLVCGGLIFFSFYSRYLQLYLLVAVYPIALSTLPGGRGVNNTSSSFIRTFIAKCFEVMIMALALTIGSKMCQGIDFLSSATGIASMFDGAIQAIQCLASMIILAGAVRGTDTFMRRTFAL